MYIYIYIYHKPKTRCVGVVLNQKTHFKPNKSKYIYIYFEETDFATTLMVLFFIEHSLLK